MAQTATERTSWVLKVPYHASADQVMGHVDSANEKLFDVDAFAPRGQFRSNDVVKFSVENLGDVPVTSITFKDSPDNVTFSAVSDDDHNPAYPVVVEGRVSGRILLNDDVLYLQVLGHQTTDVARQGLIRLTLEKISGGYPNE